MVMNKELTRLKRLAQSALLKIISGKEPSSEEESYLVEIRKKVLTQKPRLPEDVPVDFVIWESQRKYMTPTGRKIQYIIDTIYYATLMNYLFRELDNNPLAKYVDIGFLTQSCRVFAKEIKDNKLVLTDGSSFPIENAMELLVQYIRSLIRRKIILMLSGILVFAKILNMVSDRVLSFLIDVEKENFVLALFNFFKPSKAGYVIIYYKDPVFDEWYNDKLESKLFGLEKLVGSVPGSVTRVIGGLRKHPLLVEHSDFMEAYAYNLDVVIKRVLRMSLSVKIIEDDYPDFYRKFDDLVIEYFSTLRDIVDRNLPLIKRKFSYGKEKPILMAINTKEVIENYGVIAKDALRAKMVTDYVIKDKETGKEYYVSEIIDEIYKKVDVSTHPLVYTTMFIFSKRLFLNIPSPRKAKTILESKGFLDLF